MLLVSIHLKRRTHPSGFALILECFFGVLRGRLHIIHRVFDVVLYAIYHLALHVGRRRETQEEERMLVLENTTDH